MKLRKWPKLSFKPSFSPPSPSPSPSSVYAPNQLTFKYFPMVVARSNFVHTFFMAIPRGVFRKIPKNFIFSRKIAFFRSLGLRIFLRCHLTPTLPNFKYFPMVVARSNFVHTFFTAIPRGVFQKNPEFFIFIPKNSVFS